MHALWTFWLNYFGASLKGNGPEALVQTVVYGLIAIAVIPVVRHFLHRELTKAHAELHAKLDALVHHHEEHARKLDLLLAQKTPVARKVAKPVAKTVRKTTKS